MHAAEYGKWKNWYRGDWLTGVYRTHELVQDYADHLKDPMAKLPAPASWSGWEAYFHIMEYEDDRQWMFIRAHAGRPHEQILIPGLLADPGAAPYGLETYAPGDFQI